MPLTNIRLFFTCILTLSLVASGSFASDAYIRSGIGHGQGFLFEREAGCYLGTPAHVLNGNESISMILANRREYQAELVNIFATDLAVLKVNDDKACRLKQPETTVALSSLLKIYNEGVLKTKLEDASTQQTKVLIRSVDEGEYLLIRSENTSDVLKQGYSGSVLYIANEPAGILLQVDADNEGLVLRQDAIEQQFASFFGPPAAEQLAQKSEPAFTIGTLTNNIEKDKKFQQSVTWEENSPVIFKHAKQATRFRFNVSVLRPDGKVIYEKKVDTAYDQEFVFTPPSNDDYFLTITGTRGAGTFKLDINQYARDSDLRNPANVIDAGGRVNNLMAEGTIAEYLHGGQTNSPIKFYLPKQELRHKYDFSIVDSNGKALFAKKIDTAYEYEFAYTPATSDLLKIRLTGAANHGSVELNLDSYIFDADLRGAANIIDAGDTVNTLMAAGAIAEYKYAGQENSPIKFYLPKQGLRHKYTFSVINDQGKDIFNKRIDTAYEYEFAFTPPTTSVYGIQLAGLNDHGPVSIATSQYALDSELRGAANEIDIGDTHDLVLAAGATAAYRYMGLNNSPVIFYLPKQEPRHKYTLSVVGGDDRDLFSKKIDTAYEYELAYTPLADAPLIIKLAGQNDHGPVSLSMEQLALDADLRGAANLINIGSDIEGKLAKDAIAEYRINAQEGQTVKLYFPKQDKRHQYTFTVVDSVDRVLLTKKVDTAYEYDIEFNPPASSTYTLRFVGLKEHGQFAVSLN